MRSFSRQIGGAIVAVAFLLSPVATAPAAARQSSDRYFKAYSAASRARKAKKYERALRKYERAVKMAPANPMPMMAKAATLAEAGRMDEFWVLLDEALELGYDRDWQLIEEPALEPYRETPEFSAALQRARANAKEHWEAIYLALDVPDPDDAPPFESFGALEQSFDDQADTLQRDAWKTAPAIRYRSDREIVARRIAALRRYLRERPHAPDAEAARLDEIRSLTELADTYATHWRENQARAIQDASERFLRDYGDSEDRTEVELLRALAVLRGVLDPSVRDGVPPEHLPDLRCDEALPLFEQIIVRTEAGPWSRAASGFKAWCLAQPGVGDPDAAREAYEAFLARGEAEGVGRTPLDYRLGEEVREVRLRLDGAPEISAVAVDGREIALSDLEGHVVLIEFWGPG